MIRILSNFIWKKKLLDLKNGNSNCFNHQNINVVCICVPSVVFNSMELRCSEVYNLFYGFGREKFVFSISYLQKSNKNTHNRKCAFVWKN